MTFTELGASPELSLLLENRGIKNPTEIQKLVFSPIVEGKSVLGLSKTGSGKTLAYLLPLVQRLLQTYPSHVAAQNEASHGRVLILCPTRELAHQIHSEIKLLLSDKSGASLLVVGGDSEAEQLKGFASSLFIVATPGRLLDLIKNSGLPLGSVHQVVLDEADRLLDMGFQEDIRDILGRVPKGFQLVCLSATLHLGVEELIFEMGVDFVRVNSGSDADLTVEGLDHSVAFVGDQEKFHFLANFLKNRQDQRGIIFSNYRESTHRISKRLEGLGYRAEALSAQLSQPQRRKIMESFRNGALDILVASDVAARGLDVDALDFVLNFELPDDSATYVHRIGRTARAGRKGVAVSLVGFEDSFRLEKLEAYLKSPISRFSVDHSWLEGTLPRGKHHAPRMALDASKSQAKTSRDVNNQSAVNRSQGSSGEGLRKGTAHSGTHQSGVRHGKSYTENLRKNPSSAKQTLNKASWVKRFFEKIAIILGLKKATSKAKNEKPLSVAADKGSEPLAKEHHKRKRHYEGRVGGSPRDVRRGGRGRRRRPPAGPRRDGGR